MLVDEGSLGSSIAESFLKPQMKEQLVIVRERLILKVELRKINQKKKSIIRTPKQVDFV